MSVIHDYLKFMVDAVQLNKKQHEFYSKQLSNYKEVTITKIADLPEQLQDDVNRAITIVAPALKQCYRNSQNFTLHFTSNPSSKAFYIEGYYTCYSLPIEHAFNKLLFEGKEYYIDITAELSSFPDTGTREYGMYLESPKNKVLDFLLNSEMYSSIFNYNFFNN